jgi:hypothetical protein
VLQDDFVIFASNLAGLGGTDLYVADYQGTDVVPLSRWLPGVNSELSEYGCSLWFAP